MLQYITVCCSEFAVCCSVLQCVAACCSVVNMTNGSYEERANTCLLQCVIVNMCLLQCVIVCLLQCVIVFHTRVPSLIHVCDMLHSYVMTQSYV